MGVYFSRYFDFTMYPQSTSNSSPDGVGFATATGPVCSPDPSGADSSVIVVTAIRSMTSTGVQTTTEKKSSASSSSSSSVLSMKRITTPWSAISVEDDAND